MNTNKTERENNQLVPFTFENHDVRTVMIDGAPWFIAKDVCDILGIQQPANVMRDFPKSEKGVYSIHTSSENGTKQRREMLTVNEPGLYRLIFQSRKPEAEKFKTWVFSEVLPQIRCTGTYSMKEVGNVSGRVYALFSSCHDMTLQDVNRLVYYFSMLTPLAEVDIARLMGVSDSTINYYHKRLSSETAQEMVKELGINALGIAKKLTATALLPARETLPAEGGAI
jgi:prophage antirepressor-like protein